MSSGDQGDKNKKCEEMPVSCILRFRDLEREQTGLKKDMSETRQLVHQIHAVVCGENGTPGLGERSRNAEDHLERHCKKIEELENDMRNLGWKTWEKVAGVLMVIIVLATMLIQAAEALKL